MAYKFPAVTEKNLWDISKRKRISLAGGLMSFLITLSLLLGMFPIGAKPGPFAPQKASAFCGGYPVVQGAVTGWAVVNLMEGLEMDAVEPNGDGIIDAVWKTCYLDNLGKAYGEGNKLWNECFYAGNSEAYCNYVRDKYRNELISFLTCKCVAEKKGKDVAMYGCKEPQRPMFIGAD